jgi:hypothetical protein
MMRVFLAASLCSILTLAAGAAPPDDPPPAKDKAKGLLMHKPELLFKKMDANGDGKVSKEEFQDFMSKFGPPRLREKTKLLDRVFDRADTNGDGSLSLQEFKDLLEKLRERFGKQRPKEEP